MQHTHKRFTPLLGLLLLTVLLASCATAPRDPVETRSGAQLVAAAETALAAGDDAAAARLLEQAAARVESPEREHLQLRAASLYLYLEDIAAAEEILRHLPLVMPQALQYHRELLEVRRLLLLERPAAAYLTYTTMGEAPAHLRLESLRVLAQASSAVGLLLESAEARAELDAELTDPTALEQNRAQLWSALSQAPMELLRERMPPPPDAFGGWLELAFVMRSHRLDPDQLERNLERWQQRYPAHPASDELLPQLLARSRDQLVRPQQLALLLPLSGPLASAGQAVRDGFLAAYYAAGSNRPDLRIYDLGAQNVNILSAYEEAVAAGADFIVGPLSRESVAALAARGELPVPTLALNNLPADINPPSGLYQFGLSPEDEARAAAQYAIASGYENALVLVPEGDWGERVARAFSESFSGDYQQVLETAYYRAEGADFAEPIRELLNLDASDRRLRQLRSTLQQRLHFEPRRRQDADFIFVGAFPREARLIQPQLRFHHAMDMPVVATSHVFSGTANRSADEDMHGISFVDMPWLLDPQPPEDGLSRADLQAHWPGVERQPRLYALGIDAYRILPYLEALRVYPEDSLDGKSGILQVGADGRVQRSLLPARFNRGVPRLESRAAGAAAGR